MVPTKRLGKNYCGRFELPDKKIRDETTTKYLWTLDDSLLGINPGMLASKQTRSVSEQSVSCEQLWLWTMHGTVNEAGRVLQEALGNLHAYAFELTGTGTITKVLGSILEKLNQSQDGQAPNAPGQEGNAVVDDPCPKPIGRFAFADPRTDGGQVAIRAKILSAAMMFKKVTMNSPVQEVMRQVTAGDGGYYKSDGIEGDAAPGNYTSRALVRKQKEEQLGQSQRAEAYAVIHLLPYIQGFLLYILALTYPFFCLLIVVPGQAGSFFLWVALWVWVKSWDVGWALIMLADNIIWELLPKSQYFADADVGQITPVTLLEFAYSGDSSYSISTYWVLLASMISGVPLVTAYAVLGSKRALASRLVGQQGIGDIANKFGGTMSDLIGGQQVGRQTKIAAQGRMNSQIARGASMLRKSSAATEGAADVAAPPPLENAKEAGIDGASKLGGDYASAFGALSEGLSDFGSTLLNGGSDGGAESSGGSATSGEGVGGISAAPSSTIGGGASRGGGGGGAATSGAVAARQEAQAVRDEQDELSGRKGAAEAHNRYMLARVPELFTRYALRDPDRADAMNRANRERLERRIIRQIPGVDMDIGMDYTNDPELNREINRQLREHIVHGSACSSAVIQYSVDGSRAGAGNGPKWSPRRPRWWLLRRAAGVQ